MTQPARARALSREPHVDCEQFRYVVVDLAMTDCLDSMERDRQTFQFFARAFRVRD
ncbi:hypothetical protein K788_00000450 [Paraburkholderia caribensis MBA4]|uniref:Uncharacterized protein n=1 Tax=Paraburkholderia caribensis MBA4 TaxID=1323664 RepID=A0A0P0RJE8_9BURK|nr:hypothetical protein K788_00000450 [Paraburkholderia caribensis MBA4]